MLLNGPVKNDHRVIKMINSLSKKGLVDLYYVDGGIEDKELFNKNVSLNSYNIKKTFKRKCIKHTFFCYEQFLFVHQMKSQNMVLDDKLTLLIENNFQVP